MIKVILCKFIFFNFVFSSIHINHGICTSITNNGQRLMYANEIFLLKKIKISSSIGFHNETNLSINYYNQLENNSINGKNYLPINIGYNKNVFENSLAGNIKPYFYTEIGNLFLIKKFNLKNIELKDIGNEISIGFGLNFNKIKVGHYISFGYRTNNNIDGKYIINFKMIWR